MCACVCCMQYNDWPARSVVARLPDGAISARSDMRLTVLSSSASLFLFGLPLLPSMPVHATHGTPQRKQNAKASGGIDTKLTSSALIAQQQAWCISGPTHQQQAAFSWQQAPWNAVAHEGQPSTFLFDYVLLGGLQ